MTKTIHVSYIRDKILCTQEKSLTPKYGEKKMSTTRILLFYIHVSVKHGNHPHNAFSFIKMIDGKMRLFFLFIINLTGISMNPSPSKH